MRVELPIRTPEISVYSNAFLNYFFGKAGFGNAVFCSGSIDLAARFPARMSRRAGHLTAPGYAFGNCSFLRIQTTLIESDSFEVAVRKPGRGAAGPSRQGRIRPQVIPRRWSDVCPSMPPLQRSEMAVPVGSARFAV